MRNNLLHKAGAILLLALAARITVASFIALFEMCADYMEDH